MNGVPICKKCHCRIHARNNPLDTLLIIDKMTILFGQSWLNYIKDNI